MTSSREAPQARLAAAHAATSRSAFARFVAAAGLVLTDATSKIAARAQFDARMPLLDPAVMQMSHAAVALAVGARVQNVTFTTWPAIDRTYGGVPWTASWGEFFGWLAQLGHAVAPKGQAIVYNPTLTTDGHRHNPSTVAVHELILDCDGTGTWDELWSVATALGLALLTHESGGAAPGVPKWRAVIPLARPFAITRPGDVEAWRAAYATCRIVFGSVAQLRGAGFDPATDAPSHAWFPGCRRTTTAPPRRAYCVDGAALDLDALLAALPQPPQQVTPATRGRLVSEFPSFLELLFAETDMLGRDLGRGRSAVICPWNDCHTQPLTPDSEPSSATVIFPPNSPANIGAFWCAHSSCGAKDLDELLAVMPADAVQRARLLHRRAGGGTGVAMFGSSLPVLPSRLPRLWGDLP